MFSSAPSDVPPSHRDRGAVPRWLGLSVAAAAVAGDAGAAMLTHPQGAFERLYPYLAIGACIGAVTAMWLWGSRIGAAVGAFLAAVVAATYAGDQLFLRFGVGECGNVAHEWPAGRLGSCELGGTAARGIAGLGVAAVLVLLGVLVLRRHDRAG